MDLKTIRDAFDCVTEKQKVSSSKTYEMIDRICFEVEDALTKIQNPVSEVDTMSLFSELNANLADLCTLSQLDGTQGEVSIALSKYPKFLEKSFNPDISKAYRNVDIDHHIINHIIASHFYRQKMFDIGDTFIAESNVHEAAAVRSQFLEMYHILSALTSRNLEPALTWAFANHEKLIAQESNVAVKLHSLKFLDILQRNGMRDAMTYSRTFLAPFATSHISEIQKLMACLLYAQNLDNSPYADLLSPVHWETIREEFTQEFCATLGQSYESPLSVTIAAGIQALPQLLKLMNLIVEKKQEDWRWLKQLPVPLDLDKQFQFHSIFVCPVSKDQASENNPPMLMSCGHVLCRHSIAKMSKNYTKSFKCPYCPVSVDSKLCRQLYI